MTLNELKNKNVMSGIYAFFPFNLIFFNVRKLSKQVEKASKNSPHVPTFYKLKLSQKHKWRVVFT